MRSEVSENGRGVFYTRDSGGQHEQSIPQYVGWAQKRATELNVRFSGTPEKIEHMMRTGQAVLGDLFLDYGVSGNKSSRPALDALKAAAAKTNDISHIFIPRRDRLARPDDPLEGLQLEKEFRGRGITLVFMNRELSPLRYSQRPEIGEAISAYFDYHESGQFRDDLAEKMLFAQLQLAKNGFSTGGSPPFGFRRFLVDEQGTPIRQLVVGEHVRQRGMHVVWLPGPEEEVELVKRIIAMLEVMPASQVARKLNQEGVPSPDFGKQRKDNGVVHPVSGIWHQTTITNIGRNLLLAGIATYGRRSMGDRRRFTPEGPREIELDDLHLNKKPRVIQNPEALQIRTKGHGQPVISQEQATHLNRILAERGKSQRGKPRSRNPEMNPLGARVFDLACGWPMYRQPYKSSFRYTCGWYQQSHAQECSHNHIDGPTATRFCLMAIREICLKPKNMAKLIDKIQQKLSSKKPLSKSTNTLISKQGELEGIESQLRQAARNLALATNPASFSRIEGVISDLEEQERRLKGEISVLQNPQPTPQRLEGTVEAALAHLQQLPAFAERPESMEGLTRLFRAVNLELFLRFQPVKKGKRTLNRLVSGVITLGNAPAPVKKYMGPTGRRALQGKCELENQSNESGEKSPPNTSTFSDPKANSLGNANRDDRI